MAPASDCVTGAACCSVPPCACGTYVNCFDDVCRSARCEVCPEGFFCDCSAACARLDGGGGFDLIRPCPTGHYCPFGSGAPVPCPAKHYSSKANVAARDGCVPCSFPLTSSEGASFCFLAVPSLLAIIGAVLGCCLCVCLGVWGRRHYHRRKAAQEHEYLEQAHANSLRSSVLGHHGNVSEMGFYDDGDDDEQWGHANGDPRGRHEGEPAASSASAARMTAEGKKLALQQRMEELENGTDQIFRLKAEAKQKADEEARQKSQATKPKRAGRMKGIEMSVAGSTPAAKQPVEDIEVCV